MMVAARLDGPNRIIISDATRIRGMGDVIRREADRIQEAVAVAFEGEFAYGGGLKRNTAAYDARKVAEGYDPRRGHRTNELQDALYDVKAWSLRRVGPDYHLVISDDAVIRMVWHAEYYIASKTRRRMIMAFTRADAATLSLAVSRHAGREQRLAAKAKQKARRVKPVAPPSKVAIAPPEVARLTRQAVVTPPPTMRPLPRVGRSLPTEPPAIRRQARKGRVPRQARIVGSRVTVGSLRSFGDRFRRAQ